ncbi:Olfactory receptor 15 [Heterocephalus glaber]|uniref:Olfactory receptor 15 n=1 Tax=Heterocephalus glaber TaxID=10181 RepID=G5B079_HETGA|nr:Olfactory receptor 15 [Heterocephalus glaber]
MAGEAPLCSGPGLLPPHPGREQLHHFHLPGGPQTPDTHVQLLDNFSLLDLGLTFTIMLQLLANLWAPDKIYIFSWTGCFECVLLAMMAIDRYMAICQPLQYTLIMHPWVYVQMAAASWSSDLGSSLLHVTLSIQIPLCWHHTLDHFFCEVPVLIKLACGDITVNELTLVIGAIPFSKMAPLMVVIPFIFIDKAVLKIPLAEGRNKTLRTCSSHLHLVTIYFGPAIEMYLQLPANHTQAKFISFFYGILFLCSTHSSTP